MQERDLDEAEGVSSRRVRGRRWSHPFTIIRRIFGNAVFSSLTRRILFFNLAALVVLVGGILYLNQFREGLIDARVESLLTQGEIIAGAVSASASVDTNSITIDPEKLLELQAGQSITPVPNDEDLEFPIDPEKVAPVLRRLISPTRTRARVACPGSGDGAWNESAEAFHFLVPHHQLLLALGCSIFFCASSSAFFMLRVSAPCEGGKSIRLFRCAAMIGPAAVGAHSLLAKNLRPM